MSQPLDELYLTWLYHQVGSIKLRNPARTFWSLFRQLHITEFVWIVPNDDNRVEDGRDLRQEFIQQERIDDVDRDWMELGCSMLELLIGLSRVLAFEAEGEPRDWFWTLIENLGLEEMNDRTYRSAPDVAERIICETANRVIWRTYSPDGRGGLFPLDHPEHDQRDVEIWYQLNAYLLERY